MHGKEAGEGRVNLMTKVYLATLSVINCLVSKLSAPQIVRPYLATVVGDSTNFSTAFLSAQ